MKPLIGNRTEIQQPIQMHFNELIAGFRRCGGQALWRRSCCDERSDAQYRRRAGEIPGTGDVSAEHTYGAPTFDVKIGR